MAYDHTSYGPSPFAQPTNSSKTITTRRTRRRSKSAAIPSVPEALSDQVSESPSEPPAAKAETPPELPTAYAPTLKPRPSNVSAFYLPKGRVSGLNLVGEAVGWLMAWGTVGFFRAYLPVPVLTAFDKLFTPWGMAAGTLGSALVIGQLLQRYAVKISALRTLATTAIEYGESHHRADTQTNIDDLLRDAEKRTDHLSRWLVSWLTALGCLFIIGAFY